MALDFFEATQETIRNLNQTERHLFDYVVKNMDEVKHMSIQKFAAEQFLSTTTIFRFAQRLGFSGYADFIISLLVTAHSQQDTVLPDVVLGRGYSEEYLKNAMEAVRVMSPKQVDGVVDLLTRKPHIYILTDDNTHAIGQYCERLFIGLGFHAYFPETAYQRQNLVNRIRGQDMLIALSYSGKDSALIDFIERVFLTERPYLLSITRADNNPLESLSDANFYVFADEVRVLNMDLTSSVTMLMIVELLVYEYIARQKAQEA
ncbi:MAG: MurR/RpiR family transcriptional regulator [Defluviitaleaceae bacterium]|nr:MurR/RpiR family transcriptional regulator [Defluviitaleaceae bacterium]